MNGDHLSRAIEEVERGLRPTIRPSFGGVRALRRSEIATAVAVVALLVAGAVPLTVGLAMPSWAAFGAGVLAYLKSFAIDAHRKYVLDRTPGHSP